MRHFVTALDRVQPSVSPKDQRVYHSLRQRLRRSACESGTTCLGGIMYCQVILELQAVLVGPRQAHKRKGICSKQRCQKRAGQGMVPRQLFASLG